MGNSLTMPEGCTEEHLLFLDDLRESGITNMYGASPYLTAEYEISPELSRNILSYWMRTFSERHKVDR